jgi:hypothetical protein
MTKVPPIVYVVMNSWRDTFLTTLPNCAVAEAIRCGCFAYTVPLVSAEPTGTAVWLGELGDATGAHEVVIRTEVVQESALEAVDVDTPEVLDALELARRRLYDSVCVSARLGQVRLEPYDGGMTVPNLAPPFVDRADVQ